MENINLYKLFFWYEDSEIGIIYFFKFINNNLFVSCVSVKVRYGNYIISIMYYVFWYRLYVFFCLVSLFSLDFLVLVKVII